MSCRRLKEINGLVVHGRVSMRTVNHSVAHLGTNIEIFDQSSSLSVASVFPVTKQ